MFKVLVKKQLFELNSIYLINPKTGSRRSGLGVFGMVMLFVFVYGSVSVAFVGISTMLADGLLQSGFMAPHVNDWLYFALIGSMAILLSTIGSAFITFNGLYRARDNELLLSLPLKPSQILLSRIVAVFANCLLYTAIPWIPSVIIYWAYVMPTVTGIVFPILLTVIISLFVSVLCCLMGWLIAMISVRLKNKSGVTVVISLVFITLYYLVIGRMNILLTNLLANADAFGKAIKGWIYPIYQMGLAATGEILPMVIFTVISIVMFILCIAVLSRNFTKIVTMKPAEKKVEYKEKDIRQVKSKKALFNRELKHFFSCPTYILNCGLGSFIMLSLSVFMFIKGTVVKEYIANISSMLPEVLEFIPLAITASICVMLAINAVTAPSISLEGKNLWIIRSLPVSTLDILKAKEKLQLVLNIIPGAIMMASVGIVLEMNIPDIILSMVIVVIFVYLSADFGLMLNLKNPNFEWTSEAIPIKQGLPVVICLFGGWAFVAVTFGLSFLVRNLIAPSQYFIVLLVVYAILMRLTNRWLRTKGVQIFEEL